MPESVHLSAGRGPIPVLGGKPHPKTPHRGNGPLLEPHAAAQPEASPSPDRASLCLLHYALHGTGGEEKQLNPKYYASADEPKQIWEIPEASHTGGITAKPKEYERRVIGFFDDALLDGSA